MSAEDFKDVDPRHIDTSGNGEGNSRFVLKALLLEV
jgi:hypothetical protein